MEIFFEFNTADLEKSFLLAFTSYHICIHLFAYICVSKSFWMIICFRLPFIFKNIVTED